MVSAVKDVLYAGVYHLADGRKFICKKEEIPHYHQRMKDMLSAGVPIPFTWEHQNSYQPKSRGELEKHIAEKTRHTLGWVEDSILNPGGFVEHRLKVPHDDDFKRLPSIRFVSPTVDEDWTDPDGRFWPGKSIIAVAATARPVQMHQRPFALSQEGNKKGPWNLSAVQLGEYPMADEIPEKPEGDEDDTLEPDSGADAKMKDVIEKLKSHNLILGDDTTKKNFFDRICVALDTKAAHEGNEPGAPDNAEQNAQEATGQLPMMMSIEVRNRVTAAEARAKRAEDILAKDRRKSAKSKARLLTGIIGKPSVDELIAALDKEPVTLSVEGSSPTMVKIDAYLEVARKFTAINGGAFVNLSQEAKESIQTIPDADPDRHEQAQELDHEVVGRLSRGRYVEKTEKKVG